MINRLFALTALFVATAPLLACSGEPNGPSEPAVSSTSEGIVVHGGCTFSLANGINLFSGPNCTGQLACATGHWAGGLIAFPVASYWAGINSGYLLPYGPTDLRTERFVASRQCVNTTSIAPDTWRYLYIDE